tara:strand:+ start:91 stop:789 length:699 start_codon:yes stop_codon:yes gene_type:complete
MKTNNYKKELEKVFSLDFGSPYFPLLANIYLEEKDLRRAEKVCEIGLQHNPKNSDGQYVLSKVFIENEQFIKAERLLKKVIIHNPIHLGAIKKLLSVLDRLDRSKNTMAEYHKLIMKIDNNNADSASWLEQYSKSLEIKKPKKPKKPISNKNEVKKAKPKIIPENLKEDFIINEKMATFSMVEVLISQTHFYQALSTLEILEKKGEDSKKIKKLKTTIDKALKEINQNNQLG